MASTGTHAFSPWQYTDMDYVLPDGMLLVVHTVEGDGLPQFRKPVQGERVVSLQNMLMSFTEKEVHLTVSTRIETLERSDTSKLVSTDG